MKRAICIGFAVALATTATTATLGQESGSTQARRMVDTYCASCHSARVKAGGVVLDTLPLDAVAANAAVWEQAVRKLRSRLMPPPESRQPDQRDIDAFVTWMEGELDRGAASGPVAGHVPIQRMTRTEYATAVNDLLGLELDAKDLLPAEIEVNGFDNIAAALSLSPAFLDQYVAAARRAARLAVGGIGAQSRERPPIPQPKGATRTVHVDGLPLGTRGGMKFRHTFPADGEYRFTIPDLGVDLYTRATETRHTLVMLVDGTEVFRESLGGLEDMRTVDRGGAPPRAEVMKRFTNIPIQIKSGPHDVAFAFIERARIESDEFVAHMPGDSVQPRRPRAANGGRRPGGRAVQFSRRLRHAEPPARLHLPALRERRPDLCPPHHEPGAK